MGPITAVKLLLNLIVHVGNYTPVQHNLSVLLLLDVWVTEWLIDMKALLITELHLWDETHTRLRAAATFPLTAFLPLY